MLEAKCPRLNRTLELELHFQHEWKTIIYSWQSRKMRSNCLMLWCELHHGKFFTCGAEPSLTKKTMRENRRTRAQLISTATEVLSVRGG